MSLNALMAKRAELLKELAAVEEAIANFANAESIEIQTSRNLRNTPYVSVNTEEACEMLVVFADEAMTLTADRSSHGGFVSKAAWSAYKLNHPEYVDDKIWTID